MKKKITKPEWFDLARYEPTSQLNAIAWYYELIIRKHVLDHIETGSLSEWDLRHLLLIRSAVFIHPLYLNSDKQEPQGNEEWIQKYLRTNAVRLTTCGDVSIMKLDEFTMKQCISSSGYSALTEEDMQSLENIVSYNIELNENQNW